MTNDLEALTTDELYFLRLDVLAVLRAQLLAKKNVLEKRLQQLQPPAITRLRSRSRAGPIPAVSPKFRNPDQSSETCQDVASGRAG